MQTTTKKMCVLGIASMLGLLSGLTMAQGGPPEQVLPEGIRGGSEIVPADGVEIRSYRFEPTGEELPYSVFVSSRIEPGEKAPLIIALRGFTGTTLTFVRGTAVDLAEEGGFILVGAIGYNNRAGFGVPPRERPTAAPPGPAAANAPVPARPMPPLVGGSAETDPAKVTAFSERMEALGAAVEYKEFEGLDHGTIIMGSMPEVFDFFGRHNR